MSEGGCERDRACYGETHDHRSRFDTDLIGDTYRDRSHNGGDHTRIYNLSQYGCEQTRADNNPKSSKSSEARRDCLTNQICRLDTFRPERFRESNSEWQHPCDDDDRFPTYCTVGLLRGDDSCQNH